MRDPTVRLGVLSWKKGTRRAGWVARGSELGARMTEAIGTRLGAGRGSELGARDIGWVARIGAGSPWERMGATRITLGLAGLK